MVAKQVSLSSLTTVKFNGIDITKIVWNNEVMWERKVVQETRKVWVTSGYYQSGTGVVASGGAGTVNAINGSVTGSYGDPSIAKTGISYWTTEATPSLLSSPTPTTIAHGDYTYYGITKGPPVFIVINQAPNGANQGPSSVSWTSWTKKGTTQVWVDTSHEETVTEDITQYAYMNK